MGNGMMDQMMGVLGDQLLVNGKPDVTMPIAARAYRLRLLNGSNSRIYNLGWEDGAPFTVIGTDGGLLEKPVERPYLTLAPAERVEIWVDFSGRSLGSEAKLVCQNARGIKFLHYMMCLPPRNHQLQVQHIMFFMKFLVKIIFAS